MSAPSSSVIRRRRLTAALAALAAVAIAVAGLALALGGGDSGGDTQAPYAGAAKYVPADALAYVHVAADRARPATRDGVTLLRPFPYAMNLWKQLEGQLAAGRAGYSFDRDVQPWLGRDAALALLANETDTAASLLLVEVRDRARAQTFMERNTGARTSSTYRGVAITAFRTTAMAFVDRYLAIGSVDVLHDAIDVARGKALALAGSASYRRAARDLDPARFGDAYVSRAGVRRVLAPQSGVLGILGTLLDKPTLVGASLTLTATAPGARVVTHSVLDPKLTRSRQPTTTGRFEPSLLEDVPGDAMALMSTRHLDRSSGVLLGLVANTVAGPALTQLLSGAGVAALSKAGSDLSRTVLPLLRGEAAVWLTPTRPSPTLGVMVPVGDERATAAALERLHEPLGALMKPKDGEAPRFRSERRDGLTVWSVRLAPGAELFYAVFDGKLVVSTRLDGIEAVRAPSGPPLARRAAFRATLGKRPRQVSSLVFLDLAKLLRLGEQTGLAKDEAFQSVRPDLSRVGALGAAAAGSETESTSELTLQIP